MEVKSGSIRLTEWLKTAKGTWGGEGQKLNLYSIISWNIEKKFSLNSFLGLLRNTFIGKCQI